MDIDQEMINRAAKNLSDDIDFEVMTYVLCAEGWTKVVLDPMSTEQSDAIDFWLSKRYKNSFRTRGLVFLFKDAKDATWFILKFGKSK